MSENCIEVSGLSVAYDSQEVIRGMELTIPKNEITMIIGANGCGKSTLLKAIGRILPIKKGEVKINGSSVKHQRAKTLAREVAVLPQNPTAPAGLRVKELVAYGRFPYQSPMGGMKREDIEIVNWAMEVTGVLEFRDRMMEELSGGQRQRAWIALALAQDTPILLLDEPTTYLDMSHQLEILELLKQLNQKRKISIVMVLHELNNAAKFATHLIGMKQGEILFQGAPKKVITKKNLASLYGIDATLQLDKGESYPICIDFELVKE